MVPMHYSKAEERFGKLIGLVINFISKEILKISLIVSVRESLNQRSSCLSWLVVISCDVGLTPMAHPLFLEIFDKLLGFYELLRFILEAY